MKLSIIIPVYNEADTILKIMDKVEKAKLPAGIEKEIILVDDFSQDGTRDILKKLKNKYKRYYHVKNFGKGRALRTGFSKATGDYVLIQDADLEYDPSDYSKLLLPVIEKNALIVYGYRVINKESEIYVLHWLGNVFLSLLTSLLYLRRVKDMETGYKLMRKDIVNKLKLKSNRFDIEPEITAKLLKKKIKIHEIPITFKARSFTKGKKITWKDGIRAAMILLYYRFFN